MAGSLQERLGLGDTGWKPPMLGAEVWPGFTHVTEQTSTWSSRAPGKGGRGNQGALQLYTWGNQSPTSAASPLPYWPPHADHKRFLIPASAADQHSSVTGVIVKVCYLQRKRLKIVLQHFIHFSLEKGWHGRGTSLG